MQSILRLKQRRSISRGVVAKVSVMLSLSKHLSRFVEITIAVEMLRQAQHDRLFDHNISTRDASSLLEAQNALHDG